MTLVHFLSSSPSYFLLVAASKLSPRFSSSRNSAALLGRFVDVRYAIIDLCLFQWFSQRTKEAFRGFLQLLGLPRGQDLAHCSGGRGYIRLAGGAVLVFSRMRPLIFDLWPRSRIGALQV